MFGSGVKGCSVHGAGLEWEVQEGAAGQLGFFDQAIEFDPFVWAVEAVASGAEGIEVGQSHRLEFVPVTCSTGLFPA